MEVWRLLWALNSLEGCYFEVIGKILNKKLGPAFAFISYTKKIVVGFANVFKP